MSVFTLRILSFLMVGIFGFFIYNLVINKIEPESAFLYKTHCQDCHGEQGEGLKDLIPPLANSDYLKNGSENLACMIRYGRQGKITVNGQVYEGIMPPNKILSDIEIANILNFIQKKWGNPQNFTTTETVEKALKSCGQTIPLKTF